MISMYSFELLQNWCQL